MMLHIFLLILVVYFSWYRIPDTFTSRTTDSKEKTDLSNGFDLSNGNNLSPEMSQLEHSVQTKK